MFNEQNFLEMDSAVCVSASEATHLLEHVHLWGLTIECSRFYVGEQSAVIGRCGLSREQPHVGRHPLNQSSALQVSHARSRLAVRPRLCAQMDSVWEMK